VIPVSIVAHAINTVRQRSHATVVLNPLRGRVVAMELIETLAPVFAQRMFS